MNRRKTVSVTPAMGASTVAGVTKTVPRRTSAGTRVSAGIACSLGLSQSFFTVKPLPAISTSFTTGPRSAWQLSHFVYIRFTTRTRIPPCRHRLLNVSLHFRGQDTLLDRIGSRVAALLRSRRRIFQKKLSARALCNFHVDRNTCPPICGGPLLFTVQTPYQGESINGHFGLNRAFCAWHCRSHPSFRAYSEPLALATTQQGLRRGGGPIVQPDCVGRRLLGRRCRCLRPIGLGILAAEALNAARRVYQALLAGKERVAVRANFHMNVALVGRPGLKVVPASALHQHCGVIGMNLFLGHLRANLSCNHSIEI